MPSPPRAHRPHCVRPQLANLSKHPFDRIWARLRGPFAFPLKGHECQWEKIDADRAGCLKCGKLHACQGNMNDWRALEHAPAERCPLVETDDSSHVCLITGLCFVEVRTSKCEYIDHCVFDGPVCYGPNSNLNSVSSCASSGGSGGSFGLDLDSIHCRVRTIVAQFLSSEKTVSCRRTEYSKYSQRLKHLFIRILKQRKRERPFQLPDVCSVVAEIARAEPPPQFTPLPLMGREPLDLDQVIKKSSNNISACISQICSMGFKKICQGSKFQSIVIGMLYMSRTGLRVGKLFYLPQVSRIHELLPSETYLNYLGISNKVICDTENEVKTCIRLFTEGKGSGSSSTGSSGSSNSSSNNSSPSSSGGPLSARSTASSSSAKSARQALSS